MDMEASRNYLIEERSKKIIILDYIFYITGVNRAVYNKEQQNSTYFYNIYFVYLLFVNIYCHYLVIIEFGIFQNRLLYTEIYVLIVSFVMNLGYLFTMFINKSCSYEVANCLINLDMFLSVGDTKYLRNVEYMYIQAVIILATVIYAVVWISCFIIYQGISVPFTTFMATIMFFIYYGLILESLYLIPHYIFLILRTHYLRIALQKYSNLDAKCSAGFDGIINIFWRPHFDDQVYFHVKASPEDFVQGIKLIFTTLESFQSRWQKNMILCSAAVFTICFLLAKEYIKIWMYKDMWHMVIFIATFLFYVFVSSQLSQLFITEINYMRKVCVYIMLGHENGEIFETASSLLHLLKSRDPRFSVCGMFYLDAALPFKLMASLSVYIIAEYQLRSR